MKRNGHAVPPTRRSFDEIRLHRADAAAGAELSSPPTNHTPTSPHAFISLHSGSAAQEKEGVTDPAADAASSSPRQEVPRCSAGSLATAEDPHGTAAAAATTQPHHRYHQQPTPYQPPPPSPSMLMQPVQGGGSLNDSSNFARPRDALISKLEAPMDHGEHAPLALCSALTVSESDGPHVSAPSHSTAAATAAAAAGARAAGAAVPFLFPIKLPAPSVTHLGGRRASVSTTAVQASAAAHPMLQSCDSLGNSTGTPLGGSPMHSRRRTLSVGEGLGFDTGSHGGQDEVLLDGEAAAATHSRQRGSTVEMDAGGRKSGDHNASTTTPTTTTATAAGGGAVASLFSPEVGPLPATEARGRNRLPSGTHIRRRPRSGARRVGVGAIEPGSPAFEALDPSLSTSNALGAANLRSRGMNVSIGGGGGGAAGRGGTGRMKNDVLPPGTRGGLSKGAGASTASSAAAPGLRRRADPSPAPSRPQRARKTRTTTSVATPHALVAPTFSTSSPAQVPLRGSNPPPQSPQLQRHTASAHSTSGATSPLNYSFERNPLYSSTDKDGTAAAAAATTTATTTGAANTRSSHGGAGGGPTPPSTKPPSRPRQGSLARVLVPGQAGSGSAAHLDEKALASPRLDPAQVAATYLQLCAEVGDEPNTEWLVALSPTKSTEAAPQPDALVAPVLLGDAADTQDLSAASLRTGSTVEATQHQHQQQQQQQQQQHTPRGGVRPRILTGPAASSSVSTTAFPNGATGKGPQRASTPAARPTKSAGARHSAMAATSPVAPAKRSGSVGRITAVNRPSIFGSSTQQAQQQQNHAGGGGSVAKASWSLCGTESSPSNEWARLVTRYCAEHLQPLADNMHNLQEQRTALVEALQAFVHTASTALTSSTTPESQEQHVLAHSGGGIEGNNNNSSSLTTSAAAAVPSTATSSPSTTPRKVNTARQGTVATAGPAHGARRPSTAATANAAATVKAASLSDSLQTLQAAVVTLLNTLSDGAALAHAVAGGDLAAPQQHGGAPASVAVVGGGGSGEGAGPPLPGALAALVSAPSAATSCSMYSPDDESSSVRLGASPGAGMLVQRNALPTVPRLFLASAVASGASAADSGADAAADAAPTAAAAAYVIPTRYIDYVLSQEREVAVQLGELCATVREVLGSPITPLEAAVMEPVDRNHGPGSGSAAAAAAATAIVRVEASDILSTPLFVPPRYLNNLTIAVAARGDVVDADHTAPTRSSGGGDNTNNNAGGAAAPTTPHIGASAKAPGVATPKPATHAMTKKVKPSSSKLSSSGGGTTGRSSTTSTPRARRSGPVAAAAAAYAPFFTVTPLPTTEEEAAAAGSGGDGVGDAAAVRSPSALSGDGNAPGAGTPVGLVESYLLHCVQPGMAAGSPRVGTDSGHASGRQVSTVPNWTTTDLSASVGNGLRGSGRSSATNTAAAAPVAATSSGAKQPTSKAGKASTSAGVGRSGRAGGANSSSAVGGVPTSFGGRPALSTSQKASSATTTTASGRAGKTRKKAAAPAAVASSDKSEQVHTQQQQQLQQQQRQLVKAWALWRALMPYAGSHGVSPADTPSFSPRPSSASASTAAAGVAGAATMEAPMVAAAAAGGGAAISPPAMSAPTAAASPVAAAATTPAPGLRLDNHDSNVDSVGDSTEAVRHAQAAAADVGPVEEDAVLPIAIGSLGSSPSRTGQPLHSVSGGGTCEPLHFEARGDGDDAIQVHGDDEDDDSPTPRHNNSATRARVAESMASLPSLPVVPRRLNMEDTTTLLSQRSSVGTGTPAADLAATAASPFPLSNVPAQSTVATTASFAASALAPTREGSTAPASEVQRRAALRIAVWWVSACERCAARAKLNISHATANATQRERVLAARRDAFLRLWVCRWRLCQRIQARVRRQHEQQRAGEGTVCTEDAAKARHSLTQKKDESSAAAAATTSRERFLRAKEQRKAALASVATSGTARVPSLSPSSPSAAAAAAASGGGIPVPPLPLATSGISTFVFRDLQEEGSNFTVSAMHRLLNAPPALLYTTCMAALRYPINAPMAYLDSSAVATATTSAAADSRQPSEAPPTGTDARGAVARGDGKASLTRWSAAWATNRANSLANVMCELSGDDGDDDDRRQRRFATAQERRWVTRGVLFIRFPRLRHYVCGEYEALIPVTNSSGSTGGSCVGEDPQLSSSSGRGGAHTVSPHEGTLTSGARSLRSSQRAPLSTTALMVPATMRYDSIVDSNELQRPKPVSKAFHRPFEQWGMAHNLTSRVFCAAAIYAWQLIFSHTPFDDAKQRELATRKEQQARLERVEDRNSIILDCYGVHSEREWMREATKDLSFVGQIYLPNYDQDDPEQQKEESRDNYDFVKSFLFQCFPNVHKLAEIPDYLVGAGLFFVLKEVFHYTKDSPSTRRLLEVLPRLVIAEGADHLAAVTPATSALASSAVAGTDSTAESLRGRLTAHGAAGATTTTTAVMAPRSLSPPYRRRLNAEDSGAVAGTGLSGLQRAALQRYEQLRLLHHLSHGFMDTDRGASAKGTADKTTSRVKSQQQQQQSTQHAKRTRSPATSTTSIGGAKDRGKGTGNSGCDDSSSLDNSFSIRTAAGGGPSEDANSPLRRCMASSTAGPVTPMRATPATASPGASHFTSPALLRDAHADKDKVGPAQRRASAAAVTTGTGTSPAGIAAPPSEQCVQLVRVPHQLLRATAADTQFVRDYEEEVSRSVHGILRAWNGNGGAASLDVSEMRAAVAAHPDAQDCLDIAYPRHFLVKLSEALAFELFGLQLSLSNCEDLDSTWQ